MSDDPLRYNDPDTVAAIAMLKAQFLERTGGHAGQPCQSAVCCMLATRRVFWPVLDGEEYPLYCETCAKWAEKILGVLGLKATSEPLPLARDQVPVKKTRRVHLPAE